jgi:hypothetical protein
MEKTTLLFFRNRPHDPSGKEALISSMQSLESSFLLLALERYSHALVTCASAIDSALLTSRLGATGKPSFQELITKARSTSPGIAILSKDLLDNFRKTRNRIVHSGFGRDDDSASVTLYLEIALPLIEASYRDLHSYELTDGLLQEYAQLLRAAQEVHRRARTSEGHDRSYCLNAFGHLIRWCFKQNFSASWESNALEMADARGTKFEAVEREKKHLKAVFGLSWDFDCPICDDCQSAVCELDEAQLDVGNVVPKRMACPNCHFAVRESESFMSEVLLEKQIGSAKEQILTEYGL